MTAERYATFSEEGAEHFFGSEDSPLVEEAEETAETTRRCALVPSRVAIVTNLFLFSLLAFVPGTQAKHLLHGRDAYFRHEDFPRASAAEGLVLNTVNHHCRSLETPDTFKVIHIIDYLSARSSLALSFEYKSHESRVAGFIDDTPNLKLSSGKATAGHTTSISESRSIISTIYYDTGARNVDGLDLNLTSNIGGKVPLASKSLVRCNAEAPLDRTCENDMMVSLCGFNQRFCPPYYITMTD